MLRNTEGIAQQVVKVGGSRALTAATKWCEAAKPLARRLREVASAPSRQLLPSSTGSSTSAAAAAAAQAAGSA